MDKLQEKANVLKERAKELTNSKKEKQQLFDKLNTSDMKLLQIEKDGTKLVQHVFGGEPLLVINAYQNKQQEDEQKGFHGS